MKVFVAGSTGAIGRVLVPQLVENGHEVIALVRSDRKAQALLAMGAKVATADALNKEELTAAIRKAEPEVIIHQLTALAHAGNLKKLDDEFVLTNRFRTEVTGTLLAAARLVGARRFIGQSFCGWPFAREGEPVKAEEAPLDPTPPPASPRSWRQSGTWKRQSERPWTSRRSPCATDPSTDLAPGLRRMGRLSNSSASECSRSSATGPVSGPSSTFTTQRARRSPPFRAVVQGSIMWWTTSRRRSQRGFRRLPTPWVRSRRIECRFGLASWPSARVACR